MQAINPLPPLFLARLARILTAENFDQYRSWLNQEKLTAFRINTLKASVEETLAELSSKALAPKPIPWCKEGFYLSQKERRMLTQTHLMQDGIIYIQNPSSMFASLLLDPQPGEEILDLAAAPGGKTLHIAALMANKGRIAAVEKVKDRFFRLKMNIQRAGASIVQTYHREGSIIGRLVPNRFDRVLLDAPCSSEARFDINDLSSFAYWSEKKVKEMARKQKSLIYSAVSALKPQGILIYCTCSFSPEENEFIVQHALEKFPNQLEILPITIPFKNYQQGLSCWEQQQLHPELKKSIRIIPNTLMNGFFICKLKKY